MENHDTPESQPKITIDRMRFNESFVDMLREQQEEIMHHGGYDASLAETIEVLIRGRCD